MELDDLKASWQKSIDHNIEINKKDMEELQLILGKKTSESLTHLKKKYEKIISYLLIGMISNIILQPFIHWMLGEDGPVFRLTFGGLLSLIVILSICTSLIFYYWLKYTSITENIDGADIEATLRQNIKDLNKSFRQEMLFIPTLFLTLITIGRASSQFLGNGDFWDILHVDILLALGAAIILFGFYISRRYSFYKKQIKELEAYLAEYSGNLQ